MKRLYEWIIDRLFPERAARRQFELIEAYLEASNARYRNRWPLEHPEQQDEFKAYMDSHR